MEYKDKASIVVEKQVKDKYTAMNKAAEEIEVEGE